MKKVITIILTAAILTLSVASLFSCEKKDTCFFCLEERLCVKKIFLGEEIDVCEKCMHELNGDL